MNEVYSKAERERAWAHYEDLAAQCDALTAQIVAADPEDPARDELFERRARLHTEMSQALSAWLDQCGAMVEEIAKGRKG